MRAKIIYLINLKVTLRWRGIEPRSHAWQARILPLNHQRAVGSQNDFIPFTPMWYIILILNTFSPNFMRLEKNFQLLCLPKTNVTNLRSKIFPMPGIEPEQWR